MADLDDQLERWQRAGLVDAELAGRLRAFERERDAGDSRPAVIEAVIYLGIATFGAGIFALAAQNWDELESPVRVASVALPAILALVVGFALRSTGEAPLLRGGSIAWLAAIALVTGTALVIGNEYIADGGGGDNRNALMMAGVIATLVALALWVAAPTEAQVIGVGGALVLFAEALGNWPDDYSAQVAGAFILGFGLIGIAATETGIAAPRWTAVAVFGLMTAVGPFHAGIDGEVLWAEVLTVVIGGGLVALSIVRGGFGYLAIGVGAAFVGGVTVIFEYFEDDIGAPVALMLSGALLLAAVLLLVPMRRVVRDEATA